MLFQLNCALFFLDACIADVLTIWCQYMLRPKYLRQRVIDCI